MVKAREKVYVQYMPQHIPITSRHYYYDYIHVCRIKSKDLTNNKVIHWG